MKMNYEELCGLVKKYVTLESEIMNNLPDDCDECCCDEDYETFDVIHYGNLFNEIHRYCLKCGGIQEIQEGE